MIRYGEFRWHLDPESGLPHFFAHGIDEEEVRQVMSHGDQDYGARGNSRKRLGQTNAGRYLLVVYVPDEGGRSAFVVTAYELKGKALKAYRRRQRRRP